MHCLRIMCRDEDIQARSSDRAVTGNTHELDTINKKLNWNDVLPSANEQDSRHQPSYNVIDGTRKPFVLLDEVPDGFVDPYGQLCLQESGLEYYAVLGSHGSYGPSAVFYLLSHGSSECFSKVFSQYGDHWLWKDSIQ
ncbi:hypothetical protein Pmani_016846 [Petrolisthes manimaculis]|uniref:Uncharacterized protein n=1 Tax=Petrolisthes manimaculis TaxID=1843537 RepID=A0AAE1U6A8_9EUCA|nr:hypothetical protein Pmani_016846 [Petrolisthes manimaculis]